MWRFVTAGIEGNCKLFGVNIFDFKWEDTGENITVIEPYYGEQKELDVYIANINNKIFTFAAAEITASIFGFALKIDDK